MKVLFTTMRGLFHQHMARDGVPEGLQVDIVREPSRDDLLRQLPAYHVLISERAGVIDAELIAAAPNLKLIQRLGSYTADIDIQAAQAAHVPVCSLPVRGCVLVAEHLMLQLLSLGRRVREQMHIAEEAAVHARPSRRCDEDYFAYNWSGRAHLKGLQNATVGILGFGEIGIELARRLRGFESTTLYNKRTRLPARAEEDFGVTFATTEHLLANSDYVVSLLPYSVQTDGSLGASVFSQIKRGSFFAHCGAGATVDEDALIAALRSGQLGGAALDTFTFEPLRADDPLLVLARDPLCNLLLTPHTAAGSGESARPARAQDFDNVLALMRGTPLQHRLV